MPDDVELELGHHASGSRIALGNREEGMRRKAIPTRTGKIKMSLTYAKDVVPLNCLSYSVIESSSVFKNNYDQDYDLG